MDLHVLWPGEHIFIFEEEGRRQRNFIAAKIEQVEQATAGPIETAEGGDDHAGVEDEAQAISLLDIPPIRANPDLGDDGHGELRHMLHLVLHEDA